MAAKPDEYLDGLDFLPSRMEEMVKEAIKERDGETPEPLSRKEVELRLRLFGGRRRLERMKKYRAVLAAACVFLTVGMAAAVFRPVRIQGTNTYITFYTGDGTEERFTFRYQDLDLSYGRSHDYQSFSQLEAALGFPLVKPSGQEPEGVYLESRPGSSLYSVVVYFKEGAQMSSYQAYMVKDSEASYGYQYSISQDWERLEEKELGGRSVVLYRIGDGNGYGAAFSENGIFYVTAAESGVSLEEWETVLSQMSYR